MSADELRYRNRLIQRDRLRLIERLAAGIAHEINTPLSYVTCNLGVLRAHSERSGPGAGEARADVADLAPIFDQTREGLARIGAVVRRFRSFACSRSTTGEVDVTVGLEATASLAWAELRHRCVLERRFAHLPPIRGDANELNLAFLNILLNAADAVEDGAGRVILETEVDGGEVTVRFVDDGAGIRPEHLPRLFEPFFTTKPPDEGAGLGLSVALEIVEGHGGRIEVESERGRGSAFTVRLPIDGPLAPLAPLAPGQTSSP